MADKKMGSYLDENITKHLPIEYTDDDLAFTETINTSRTVAALEKQVALYEKEIEAIKKSTRITKWAAIASAIISVISVAATIICTIISQENNRFSGQEIQLLEEKCGIIICEKI